jgi:cobyrinic acid a,c-diamide synthase
LPSWPTRIAKRAEAEIKGFVIAATGSGTGKTTLTLAMLSYLAEKGYKVAPFKIGPDFIDPGHHTQIAKKTSVNLDSWMLTREYNQRLFHENVRDSDLAVVEGVMGLFDGIDGLSEAGSTAQMAKWLNLPVVLVVSAWGKARSAAAIVKGFEDFDPDLNLAGVIFTMTGSPRHYDYLKQAVEQNCRTKCLGHLPRDESVIMPERHLGLVTAEEQVLGGDSLARLSALVRDHVDMEGLITGLDAFDLPRGGDPAEVPACKDETGPLIAVARDKAFCFYYPDNLDILKKSGARLMEFSPLKEDGLPNGIDGLYLGGGYPEEYAEELSEKTGLFRQIRDFSRHGMPIYGECGGFMVLCKSLRTMDGTKTYPMAGCFDLDVRVSTRLRSLGYREITLSRDTIIGRQGMRLRGHEFHYSSLQNPEFHAPDVYQVTSRQGQTLSLKGYQVFNTLGSYLHVHFGSNEACAQEFVRACQGFRDQRHVRRA